MRGLDGARVNGAKGSCILRDFLEPRNDLLPRGSHLAFCVHRSVDLLIECCRTPIPELPKVARAVKDRRCVDRAQRSMNASGILPLISSPECQIMAGRT